MRQARHNVRFTMMITAATAMAISERAIKTGCSEKAVVVRALAGMGLVVDPSDLAAVPRRFTKI